MSYRENALEPAPTVPWWKAIWVRVWRAVTLADYAGPPFPRLPALRPVPGATGPFEIPGEDPTTIALVAEDARRAVVAHQMRERPDGDYDAFLKEALRDVLREARRGRKSHCCLAEGISEAQTERLAADLRRRGFGVERSNPAHGTAVFIDW